MADEQKEDFDLLRFFEALKFDNEMLREENKALEEKLKTVKAERDALKAELEAIKHRGGRPKKEASAEDLKAMCDEIGATATAKKLGISRSTLYRRLRGE